MPTKCLRFFVLLAFLLVSIPARPQVKVESQAPAPAPVTVASSAPKPPGSAQPEPFIFETLQTKVRFELDGSGSRELLGRVQIKSDSALRDFGLLRFPYQGSSETLDIAYVRVRKKDGTVIPTPATDIQDMDTETSRAAPMYTDEREKHARVKSLSVGDTLEYNVRWTIVHPPAPGNFWYVDNFFRSGIVQDEQIEINLPKDRPAPVSNSIAPVITEDGNRRIYKYHSSQLEREPEHTESAWEKLLRPTPPPEIQVSSFTSWEEVGKWYGTLQRPQVQVTSEIRAKAAELTQGKPNDSEKLHAIYDFVSTRFRYIGVSFGAGRYMPHASAEVLANQYGDCKDKHTLFAALLAAAGIKSYPVLISSNYKIDLNHPSPALFDHLITAIPQADSFLYLDTTPEVAPFGLLSSAIRDKSALVIPDQSPARLLRTPADTIFPSTQKFEMVASIDEKGTLEGKARLESRGDVELLQRQAFLSTSQTQWQELTQRISASMGFGGTVSDVSAAQPDATADPFWIAYSYHRPEFPDWANHRIAVALPFLGLPPLKDEEVSSKESFPLGSTAVITFTSKISLPKGYVPELPPLVSIKRDFAEYTASYSFDDGVLTGSRKFVSRVREIPAKERSDYVSFIKAVEEDEGRYIAVSSDSAGVRPHSINAEAQRFLEQGRSAMMNGDPRSATSFLERAVELDPKWSDAWAMLGTARMAQQQVDPGIEAFRRAITLNPSNPRNYKIFGFSLMYLHKDAEAMQVWRDLLKINPEDRDASANLGNLLFSAAKYEESRSMLETAVQRNPDSASLNLQLGRVYVRLGNEKKSAELFEQALKLQPGSEMLNSIAYEWADVKVRLPDALQYASEAVHETETDSAEVRLESLDATDFRRMAALAAEWDTLGWVKFRMADFHAAVKYLKAAWDLMQSPVIGEHLAEAYEKTGNNLQAWHTYLQAYSAMTRVTDAKLREKLTAEFSKPTPKALLTGEVSAESFNKSDLMSMRTISIPGMGNLGAGYKSAEFAIAFTIGPKIEEVKFLSGAEELRPAASKIAAAKFIVSFPDNSPAKILRRGVLSCSQALKGCTFVLYPVEFATPMPQNNF